MIIFEDGIEEIVLQMPLVAGFKPNFHWGDQSELTRWLSLQEMPYPIIWLVNSDETQNIRGIEYVTRNCKFILATRSVEESDLNNVRLRGNYDFVLNPLTERLIEGITKFNRTKLNNQEFKLHKLPHFAEYAHKDVNKTIDLWDAVTIDCSITMNSKAKNTIVWQNEI